MGARAAGQPVDVPVRVLQVVDSLDGGGAERHVADLAGALRARGADVHLACSAGGVLRRRLDAAGLPVHVLGGVLVKRCADISYAGRLRQLVDTVRPDLVHAHVHASEVAAALALAADRTPLVLTEHTEAPWRTPPDRLWAQRAVARADLVVAVSARVQANVLSALGGSPGRTRLVLPAVPAARPSLRGAPPGLPVGARVDGGPVVGYVGRLTADKGVDVLLEAFARVHAVLPAARLLVTGDGPARPALEAQAADLGPAVQLLGFREDAARVLAGLDVLVVPSRADGSPLVVAEANLAGVPVVATTAGGLPDRVRPGVDGLLVPPGDAAALADALVRLLADASLRTRLAAAGRARSARESHPTMVDRLCALYRDLLDRSRSTGRSLSPASGGAG